MVKRDGRTYPISAEGLVAGDIIDVKAGDRLPADIRLVKSSGFKVSNYRLILLAYDSLFLTLFVILRQYC